MQAEPEASTARRGLAVSRLAARQFGVVDAAELAACGLTHDAIAVRARIGWLHPLHYGVYAVGHANLTRDGWMLAAVKACGPLAALCRASSAAMLELAAWEDRYPDVLVLGGNPPRHRRINGHRTMYLPPHHLTWVRGIPVTTAERTLLDLAAVWPEQRLRRAVRQAQYLKLTTVRSLAAALREPAPRRGRRTLARIIATGAAPTQSELEDAVLDLIVHGGLAHPVVNEPMMIAGRRIVPDFRWPAQRLIVEADGPHHDDPFQRADDLERQRVLEAHGERVVRVTWEQATAGWPDTLRRFKAAGAPRGVDPSG